MKFNFHDQIAPLLPNSPGVYLMKDKSNTVIYVGKAKNLKRRVSSYFAGTKTGKTARLVQSIADIDFIIVATESEALLLENNLIKKHHPKYNINLKDGKTYPVLRITNEPFPQVLKTRQLIHDGSRYFGPYTQVGMLDTYLKWIKKLFPIRRCSGTLNRSQPCLYYHLGQCCAPCIGRVTPQEYRQLIDKIEALLSGDNLALIAALQDEMEHSAAALEFEKAADFRNAIQSLEKIAETQDIVDFNPEIRDFISYAEKDEEAVFSVFQMRDGRISGSDLIYITPFLNRTEGIGQFIIQYYQQYHSPPRQIFIRPPEAGLETTADAPNAAPQPVPFADIQAFLRRHHGVSVEILAPVGRQELSVIKMGEENCRQELLRRLKKSATHPGVDELFELFHLPHRPTRIEGFDISHLHGKYTVASLISFINGQPNPSGYRSFNIRSLHGKIDDFESIREAVARRYTRLLNEKKPLPNLILIDGGAGQVSAAKGILDALQLPIPILGLAEKEEEIYTGSGEGPIRLPQGNDALSLLQQVRDETHRFATQKSFRKREADLQFSLLQQVPGIGSKRAILLMKNYGSLDRLLQQSADALHADCRLPLSTATLLLAKLKPLRGAGTDNAKPNEGTDL